MVETALSSFGLKKKNLSLASLLGERHSWAPTTPCIGPCTCHSLLWPFLRMGASWSWGYAFPFTSVSPAELACWMDKQMGTCVNRRMNEWMEEWMSKWISEAEGCEPETENYSYLRQIECLGPNSYRCLPLDRKKDQWQQQFATAQGHNLVFGVRKAFSWDWGIS